MQAIGFVELLAAKRRRSDEANGRMVAETLVPSITVKEVARRHGLKATHLSSWRTLAQRLGLRSACGRTDCEPRLRETQAFPDWLLAFDFSKFRLGVIQGSNTLISSSASIQIGPKTQSLLTKSKAQTG